MLKPLTILTLVIVALMPMAGVAQGIEPIKTDIAEYFDLKKLSVLFHEATDSEHFEFLLNDPAKASSNLDFDEDGFIDFVRCVEASSPTERVIIIQALQKEDNKWQDIVSMELVNYNANIYRLQAVGNEYIFGELYIMEYEVLPDAPILKWLFRDDYKPYISEYNSENFPAWYEPNPQKNAAMYADFATTYNFEGMKFKLALERSCLSCNQLNKDISTDYVEQSKPNGSFKKRNPGRINKADKKK